MRKAFRLSQFKALDEAKGQFEAIVAVFGNVDDGGDRVVKGAFTASLDRWAKKGRPIPVIFSHQWDNLDAHLGEVLEAKETDDGLYVKAQLEMDEPYAARVFKKLQKGTIAEFSFAYDIIEAKHQNGAYELLELDILEAGPTLVGMNRETQLLGTKAGKSSGRKASGTKQAIVGSFEERRAQLSALLQARYSSPDVWVWVMATFDDRAIFEVEDDAAGTWGYREVSYSVSSDGTITLGEEREVELRTVVTPKGREAAAVKAQERRQERPGAAKAEVPRPGTLAARMAAELLEMGVPA